MQLCFLSFGAGQAFDGLRKVEEPCDRGWQLLNTKDFSKLWDPVMLIHEFWSFILGDELKRVPHIIPGLSSVLAPDPLT